ncbi:hypothetical protein Ae201684P_007781 [Aphanomyces euteiches]|uniref:Uncharacterized protein n=1 Tax=Aphanomyces euteiches TaxID=100861 RepID=A0A6G0W3P4_9STRA|nr:hypothetical protein Ae201684_018952 [Aphanomyces euteiches]KAH9089613.1 hypothetical protein Ae201684P_007781 [Aphanomyces euteiches]
MTPTSDRNRSEEECGDKHVGNFRKPQAQGQASITMHCKSARYARSSEANGMTLLDSITPNKPIKRYRRRPRKVPRIEASSDVKSALPKDSIVDETIIIVDPLVTATTRPQSRRHYVDRAVA